jgi:hypothetical protein
MAIIRASKTFEGGDLTQRATSYIKLNTRTVDFKNKDNGVYMFILGAYKQDNAGNGVWYRPLKIRDNFGMGMYKEKFAVQFNCPIDHFANKVQSFAPEMAKSKETVDDTGRKRWTYPVWGRTAWRVLYNAALFGDYGAGVHILDLPQSGGASVIDEYVKGKQPDGSENPMINDYENAIPINIKLDLKANGQPWKIQINSAKTFVLPTELADTDYLYNLDDVISYPDKDGLIEKLRSMVPSDIFRKGMDGYSDDRVVRNISSQSEEDDLPMPFQNPVVQNPVAQITKPVSIPKANIAPTINIPRNNSAPAKVDSELPSAPSFNPGNSKALEAASVYLRKK